MINTNQNEREPLATKMRPKTLDEFFGQEEILGKDKLLRVMIEKDKISSVIFYGPPGTGKTTLAHIIANQTKSDFVFLSAVTATLADLRKVIKNAEDMWQAYKQKTLVFLDEVHRFNKAQQDALLPHVEEGKIILIGVTTENPYFEVISPLLSRTRIFEFKALTEKDLLKIMKQTLKDKKRGLGAHKIVLTNKALEYLLKYSSGDARVLLNTLEIVILTKKPDKSGKIKIDLDAISEALPKRMLLYDRAQDEHYDTASAFIKSMRGSDVDAALFWLGKMIEAGEDPKFIVRRIIIAASEDVGNADPEALKLANEAARAVDFVGWPEAQFALAQAVIYIATAPKSNATKVALGNVLSDIKQGVSTKVPKHITNKPKGKDEADYLYPHDYPDHFVEQEYLPPGNKKTYFVPQDQGFEKTIKERLKKIRKYE